MGNVIYTIASGRRGKAFVSKWGFKDNQYELLERTECCPCPISAFSLSGDAGLLALGSVDGTIILWGIERWKVMKKFPEVHDLPVTCIAARPYPVPLKGDEDGIQMHALSASADSQLACLTLQRRTKGRKSSRGSLKSTLNSWVKMALFAWILYPVANEVWDKCADEWNSNGYSKAWECIRYDVLIAPASRPGILVPPH
jgi:WD40 repeat protein